MKAMSKLKRKKSACEERRSELQPRWNARISVQGSSSGTASTTRQEVACILQYNPGTRCYNDYMSIECLCSREKWWESSELSDEERIWALTLKAFCPNLDSDVEELVPPLPSPSSTKPQAKCLSDSRWSEVDRDINPSPPASGFKNPSPSSVEKNTKKSEPPTSSDQAREASSTDQENASVSDDCGLLDKQSDTFFLVGNVLNRGESEVESKAAASRRSDPGISLAKGSAILLEPKQAAGQSESGTFGVGLWAKTGTSGSSLEQGTKSEVGEEVKTVQQSFVSESETKFGMGQEIKSRKKVSGLGLSGKSSGSGCKFGERTIIGTGQEAKSGTKASDFGHGPKSVKGKEGSSEARRSGFALGIRSGATSSELGLQTKSGNGQEVKSSTKLLGLDTNSGTTSSVFGQETKSAKGHEGNSAIGSVTALGIKPGATGSGLGQGFKSGNRQEAESANRSGLGTSLGASVSGLGMKPSLEETGSGLKTKSGTERMASESKPQLECCPMCLMVFPAGFTQMDCDGHLAQCLSEMHDDILW